MRELPVFQWRGVPIGGGSCQRLLPSAALRPFLARQSTPPVLYYHSYDFGVSLPSALSNPSPAVLQQVIGRDRIPGVAGYVLGRAGSVTCAEAIDGI